MCSWSCRLSLRSSLPVRIQTRRRSRQPSGRGLSKPRPLQCRGSCGLPLSGPRYWVSTHCPRGEMQLCLEIRSNPESSGRLLMNLKRLASSRQGESRVGIGHSLRFLESEALFVATGGEAGPCSVLRHHLAGADCAFGSWPPSTSHPEYSSAL